MSFTVTAQFVQLKYYPFCTLLKSDKGSIKDKAECPLRELKEDPTAAVPSSNVENI